VWKAFCHQREEVKVPRRERGAQVNGAAKRRTVWEIQINAKLKGNVGKFTLNQYGHSVLAWQACGQDYDIRNENDASTQTTATAPAPVGGRTWR
jgi:hypothetical protein